MTGYLLELGRLPSGVKRFIGTEVFLGIGLGITMLIFNLHMLSLGYDESAIGKLTSYSNLLQGLVSLPSGMLADRFGRKRMLAFGILLIALGVAGYGIDAGLAGLYIAQSFWAVGVTFLVTSEIQLLFHYCKDRNTESQAYGLLFAVFTLFTGVGTLLGGYLPQLLGGFTTSYQFTLYIAGGAIGICCLLRWLLLPEAEVSKEAGESKEPQQTTTAKPRQRFSFQMPSRAQWLLALVIFLGGCSMSLLSPFFNLIVKFRLEWTDEKVSLLLTVMSVFSFAGSLLLPYFQTRFKTRWVYAALFILNMAVLFLLAASLPISWFMLLFVLRGGLFTMLSNLLESESMSALPDEERNSFAALRSVFRSVGGSLAAYGTGLVLAAGHYGMPFFITGAVVTVMFIYVAWKVMPLFEAGASASENKSKTGKINEAGQLDEASSS